ncbi:MAG: hypothetical protein ACRC8A_20770 [Microcoleaceae cyanobacterium]
MTTKQTKQDTDKNQGKDKTKADSATDKKQAQSEQSKTESTSANLEHDEGQELDALLELLSNEDFATIDIEAAVEMIDHWHEKLQQSEEPNLKAMGKALKHLKKSLTTKKTKAEEITESLNQVSSEVDTFADEAERGYKTKLHTLAKKLKQFGSALEEA